MIMESHSRAMALSRLMGIVLLSIVVLAICSFANDVLAF
jgi:hypothetical protein